MTYYVGFHARKQGHTWKSMIDSAVSLISREICVKPCVAAFISGPRNTHINLTREDAAIIATCGAHIVFHAGYMDLPWRSEEVLSRAVEMAQLASIAHADLLFHASPETFEPDKRVIERLAQIANDASIRIFIETMPYDERSADPRALNAIFAGSQRIGLCIDTAHIWAAGARIATQRGFMRWLLALREDIPIAFHLNDSKNVIGTLSDIHTCLGKGEIWGATSGYLAAFQWILANPQRGIIPVILERNDDPEREVIADLQNLAHKLNIAQCNI